MKKATLLSLLVLTCFFQVRAQVCSLDTFTVAGIYPDTLVNLPTGYANAAYGTVIQIRVFTDTMSVGGNVHVTDITVNSVTGMPAGFTYACNPVNCAFPGGGNGCIYLSGNPTLAQVGSYNLVVNVTLHGKLLNVIPVSQSSQILGYKINILGAPATAFSSSATTICKGETISYSDLSANLPTSWSWNFPGGTPSSSTLQNPVITYNTSGNYNATLIAGNPAGTNNLTKTSYIHVNGTPAASFTAGGPLAICQGSSVLFTANAGSGLSYQWIKNGSPLVGATLNTYQAAVAGTYKVQVTNSSGCTKISGNKSVTVSTVLATATAGGPTTFCSGGSVSLTANAGPGLTYQWTKGGNNINGATGISYSAQATGTYKVTVTNTNGCTKASNGVSVTVNSTPSASFTANGPLTFCSTGSVLFTANSGNNQNYQWKKNGTSINGATLQTYTANKAGSYRVVVTKTNGCSKTSGSKNVIINCKESLYENEIQESSHAILFPNPTNEKTNLLFTLDEEGVAVIELYDMQGRLMSEEKTAVIPAGQHEHEFITSRLNPGFYMLVITTKNRKEALKLIISR